jgi:hypothetical protein
LSLKPVENLLNTGAQTTFDYRFSYLVVKYNDTSGEYDIPVAGGFTPWVTGYSLPVGASTVTGEIVLDGTIVGWCNYIEVFMDFEWTVGATTYTIVFGPVKLHVHPGDINNDGICDISDAALIGGNWQATAPNIVPPEADINNDGIVDIGDAAIVGGNWQATWVYNPP